MNCANWGEMFDCINTGTTTGENITHFVRGAVKNKLEIAISSRTSKINGRPLNSK